MRPDRKVGHHAFAVIRETIREMNKIAIGRVVLINREHIIALGSLDKGLMGTLPPYPYEVRGEDPKVLQYTGGNVPPACLTAR